ncbi:uncharacterized protein LOC109709490 [Ananas comosus]|uniref:Uncharacterized protein LOC109709490 n=1 Tax=Ananas comosus TaxID=4615 RepID=A0A199V5Q1_ANACO|nr:uncharacterized protein LOC109709490 [Ananas comosus]OAY72175.1 hypothetical protein ACMD2_02309 [Ananas comosus]
MLLSKGLGVRLGEALSPPAILLRPPVKMASWGLDSRGGAAAAAGIAVARGGGEGRGELVGGFSHESEHDLAMMVRDFVENGSSGADSRYSSDSDSGFSDLGHLAEKILFYKRAVDQHESDMLFVVHSLLLSIKESDLCTVKNGQCNASCIRHSLVKLLRHSGYDAAVCSSRWQGLDKVPGGDHEYIDLLMTGNTGMYERLIIEIDFRSHFEIARAVESYDAILNSLPAVFVGTLPRLKQFLQIMVEAAKWSLKQNSMPLPPWRSLSYLQAKWHSKYERKVASTDLEFPRSFSDHKQCSGHLTWLQSCLRSEIETERLLNPIITEKKRRAKFERGRISPLSS